MLEAIVAIGIITTAVSSALTLTQGSIKAESEAQAAIVAANLGREAAEVVRALRDSNWLAGREFDDGLEGPGFDYTGVPVFDVETGVWAMDFSADAIDDEEAVVYRQVEEDGTATVGLHRQATGQPDGSIPTAFRRLVTLDALCDDGAGGITIAENGSGCGVGEGKIGMRVQIDMAWRIPGRIRSHTIEYHLYDWR